MGRYIALTGTPGTGKTSAARELRGRLASFEVWDFARRHQAARRGATAWVVDLAKTSRWIREHSPSQPTLLVGHLAHFLPVREVIILRCRPDLLMDRLRSGRRGTGVGRRENAIAEAIDIILVESRGSRRRVWEIDTTFSPPASVADEVERLVRERPASRTGVVDWLADRRVTEELLR
ncbi:MAG: AAA family ATPase [Thermoplasmata archaeon]